MPPCPAKHPLLVVGCLAANWPLGFLYADHPAKRCDFTKNSFSQPRGQLHEFFEMQNVCFFCTAC